MDIPDLPGSKELEKKVIDDFNSLYEKLEEERKMARDIYDKYSVLIPIKRIFIKRKDEKWDGEAL